uniref:Uncharacterized protein n=1 Tax=Mucochytrium quahogii TaxID=96639 RepID=A0A7S2W9T6_9STRA|mmetsp:Transcript_7164/g.11399  ORF Transcript_7164/g.11399 Transcript_7164/m.11399 type:complete len:321 (+) Transcript_7164:260-1222(+)
MLWLVGGVVSTLFGLVVLCLVLMLPSVRGLGKKNGKFNIDGRVVVVTGAGNGIGKELCRAIASRFKGCTVYMIDRDVDKLEEAKQMVEKQGRETCTRVFAHPCDITVLEDFSRVCMDIKSSAGKRGEHVSLLVNNAGTVYGRTWDDLTISEFENSLRLGPLCHFASYKLFLADMLKANDGMVVTIGSLMSLLPGSKLVEYCTSKAGVLALHDAMRLEVGKSSSDGVHFLSVLPYAVDTGMFRGAFEADSLWLTRRLFPFLETCLVVDRVVVGIVDKEYSIVLPWILTFAPYIVRVLPIPVFEWCLSLMGARDGMDTLRGI